MSSLPAKAAPRESLLQTFFSSPLPMMHGEDSKVYAALLAEVKEEVRPKNFWDQTMVRDVTDHLWLQMRYRRSAGAIINSRRRQALEQLLVESIGLKIAVARKFVDAYFDFNRADLGLIDSGVGSPLLYSIKGHFNVAKLLAKHNLDETCIDQLAVQNSIDILRKLEDIASWHEVRREHIRQEIERRRKDGSSRLGNIPVRRKGPDLAE
jgi:hypothetical protein